MLMGVDYYPEHWPRERWETDAKLMREAGITRVRMGEFAWHRMEPREGQFEFQWLQDAVELLGRYGIRSILGTPTPTYPAWLHKKLPDIHQVHSDGKVKEFGQRQEACKNHAGYRRHAARIVEEMTRHFGRHPDVVAWQIDNELGCHGTTRCYCGHCQAAFQAWLKARFHGDIQSLNNAWGTVFWSQEYNDFDEISPPRDGPDRTGIETQNPGLILDFCRFSSDTTAALLREQAAVIRRNCPGRLVTHNFMGAHLTTNYFDLSRDVDVVSWDNYPFISRGTNTPPPPLSHDFMRGLKQRNVWVMEQAAGQGGWGTFAATPAPGQMRLWAWQVVARGADMVSFFRWRACRWGREQFWHGILYHHGHPQWRYEETKRLGKEFDTLSAALDGTAVPTEVAVVLDYDTVWSLEAQPQTAAGFGYKEMLNRYCTELRRLGVTADVVSPDSDLQRYKVLIVPTLHVCPPKTAERLRELVSKGAWLVLGPRSGVKDAENAVVDEWLPGALRPLAGCRVEDYDAFSALRADAQQNVRDPAGNSWQALGLAETLVPEGSATPTLFYTDHYYAGRAAAVENRIGAGRCVYLGTVLAEAGTRALLEKVLAGAGVEFLPSWPESVEMVRRVKEGRSYAFYLNHATSPVKVSVPRPGKDLLTGRAISGETEIPALDLLILQE